MFSASAIKSLIEAALPDCIADVRDDAGDGEHFSARVTSPAFEGRSLVEQQRLVYGALGDRMGREIHALALRTFTPARWAAESDRD
jgi:stress-induced morphogen